MLYFKQSQINQFHIFISKFTSVPAPPVELLPNNFQNLFSLLLKLRKIIRCLFSKPVSPKILSVWLSALRAVWNLQRRKRMYIQKAQQLTNKWWLYFRFADPADNMLCVAAEDWRGSHLQKLMIIDSNIVI